MKAFRIKERGDNKSESLGAMIRPTSWYQENELNHRCVQVTTTPRRVWSNLSHIKTRTTH